MPTQYENHLVLPEGGRVLRGVLTKSRINAAFDATREHLEATTKYRVVRRRQPVPAGPPVLWSLWIGRYASVPSWLDSNELTDLRHAYALLLEGSGFVLVLAAQVGDLVARLGLDSVEYERLVNLHSDPTTEYRGLSIRSLQPSTAGIARSSLSGQRLEQTISRIMTHRAIPEGLRFTTYGEEWGVSPTTGRVTKTGPKIRMAALCEWFSDLIAELENPGGAAPFLESFAQPQSLRQIGAILQPRALQLDPGVIQERLETGWRLEENGIQLTPAQYNELLERFNILWTLVPDDEETPPNRWKIEDQARELGSLVRRETKLSLNSSYLNSIQAVDPSGQRSSLKSWFNQGAIPFLVSFDDPSFVYYIGRLFRDHRLVGNTVHLVDVLYGELPQNTIGEKTIAGIGFDPLSLFGLTEEHAAAADYIVCDDLDREWADYIAISGPARNIRFYHCKGGSPAVGASGLHEVMAQALKNLGFLTAELPDLQQRHTRWSGTWGATLIPRLRKGASVDGFITEFHNAVSSPNFSARVILVVSGLSKQAVQAAFEQLRAGDSPGPHVSHLLWLLSFFVDGCRLVGALPKVICEP